MVLSSDHDKTTAGVSGTRCVNAHILTSEENEDGTAACSLQTCLSRNTYNPEKCDDYVRKLYQCCLAMIQRDANAQSTACPAKPVIDRWLKTHKAETVSTAI